MVSFCDLKSQTKPQFRITMQLCAQIKQKYCRKYLSGKCISFIFLLKFANVLAVLWDSGDSCLDFTVPML